MYVMGATYIHTSASQVSAVTWWTLPDVPQGTGRTVTLLHNSTLQRPAILAVTFLIQHGTPHNKRLRLSFCKYSAKAALRITQVSEGKGRRASMTVRPKGSCSATLVNTPRVAKGSR